MYDIIINSYFAELMLNHWQGIVGAGSHADLC
jgi:hypothetical protein